MSDKITGKEYPLFKVFSSDFEYHIPAYQRPYAWTEEETGILFDDLYDFFQSEKHDNYSNFPQGFLNEKPYKQ